MFTWRWRASAANTAHCLCTGAGGGGGSSMDEDEQERRKKLEAGKAKLAQFRQRKGQSDSQAYKKTKKKKASKHPEPPEEVTEAALSQSDDAPSQTAPSGAGATAEFTIVRTLPHGETIKQDKTYRIEIVGDNVQRTGNSAGHIPWEEEFKVRETFSERDPQSALSRLEVMEDELVGKQQEIEELNRELEEMRVAYGTEGLQQLCIRKTVCHLPPPMAAFFMLQEFETAIKQRDGIITQLTTNLQQARKEKDDIMREFLELTEQSQKLKIQFQHLQASETLRNTSHSSTAADLLHSKQQILSYQQQLEEREHQLTLRHREVEDYTAQVAALQAQIRSGQQVGGPQQNELELSYEQKLNEKDLLLDSLKSALHDEEIKSLEMKERISEAEKCVTELREQLTQKSQEISSLSEELTSSRQRERRSSDEIKQLMGTVEDLQKKHHRDSQSEADLVQQMELETQKKLEQLQAELDEMHGQQIVQMKHELVKQHTLEIDRLLIQHQQEVDRIASQTTISTTNKRIDELNTVINELNARLQQSDEQRNKMKEDFFHRLQAVSAEKSQLQNQIEDLLQDLSIAREQVHKARQSLTEKENKLNEASSLFISIDSLKAELAAANEFTKELESKHEAEVTNYKIKLEMLEREKDAVLDRMAESQEAELEKLRMSFLFSQEEELTKLREDLTQEHITNIENLKSSLEVQYTQQMDQLQFDMGQTITAMQCEKDSLVTKQNYLILENSKLQDLLQSVSDPKSEQMMIQINELQKELECLRREEKEKGTIEQEIQVLQLQVETLEKEVKEKDDLKEKVASLEVDNKLLKDQNDALQRTLKDHNLENCEPLTQSISSDYFALKNEVECLQSENTLLRNLEHQLKDEIERQKNTFSFAEKNFEVNYQELKEEYSCLVKLKEHLENSKALLEEEYRARLDALNYELETLRQGDSEAAPFCVSGGSSLDRADGTDSAEVVEKDTTELMEKLEIAQRDKQELSLKLSSISEELQLKQNEITQLKEQVKLLGLHKMEKAKFEKSDVHLECSVDNRLLSSDAFSSLGDSSEETVHLATLPSLHLHPPVPSLQQGSKDTSTERESLLQRLDDLTRELEKESFILGRTRLENEQLQQKLNAVLREQAEAMLQLEAQRISLTQIHKAQLELMEENFQSEKKKELCILKENLLRDHEEKILELQSQQPSELERLLQQNTVSGVESCQDLTQTLIMRICEERADNRQTADLPENKWLPNTAQVKQLVIHSQEATSDAAYGGGLALPPSEEAEKLKWELSQQRAQLEEKHAQEIEHLRSYFKQQLKENEERFSKEIIHLQEQLHSVTAGPQQLGELCNPEIGAELGPREAAIFQSACADTLQVDNAAGMGDSSFMRPMGAIYHELQSLRQALFSKYVEEVSALKKQHETELDQLRADLTEKFTAENAALRQQVIQLTSAKQEAMNGFQPTLCPIPEEKSDTDLNQLIEERFREKFEHEIARVIVEMSIAFAQQTELARLTSLEETELQQHPQDKSDTPQSDLSELTREAQDLQASELNQQEDVDLKGSSAISVGDLDLALGQGDTSLEKGPPAKEDMAVLKEEVVTMGAESAKYQKMYEERVEEMRQDLVRQEQEYQQATEALRLAHATQLERQMYDQEQMLAELHQLRAQLAENASSLCEIQASERETILLEEVESLKQTCAELAGRTRPHVLQDSSSQTQDDPVTQPESSEQQECKRDEEEERGEESEGSADPSTDRINLKRVNKLLLNILKEVAKTTVAAEETIGRHVVGLLDKPGRRSSTSTVTVWNPEQEDSEPGSAAGVNVTAGVDAGDAESWVKQESAWSEAVEWGPDISLTEADFPGIGIGPEEEAQLLSISMRLQATVGKLLEAINETSNQLEHARAAQTGLVRESIKRKQETTDLLQCQEELQERLSEEAKAREHLALELSKAEGLLDGYTDDRVFLEKQMQEKNDVIRHLEQELQNTGNRLQELEQERQQIAEEKELLSRQKLALKAGAGPAEQMLLEETEKLLQEKIEVQLQAEKDSGDYAKHSKALEVELEEQVNRYVELEQEKNAVLEDLRQKNLSLEKQLEKTRRFLDEQAVDREHERDVFQQEIQKLEQQLKMPQRHQPVTNDQNNEMEKLESHLKEKTDKCSELLLCKEQLQRDVQERNEEMEKLETRIRELEQALLISTDPLQKAEDRRPSYAGVKGEIPLEAQLQVEREAIDRKEKEITNLVEQLEQFREELENKNEEVQQLHMQLEIQRKESATRLQELEQENKVLKDDIELSQHEENLAPSPTCFRQGKMEEVLLVKEQEIELLNEQIEKLQLQLDASVDSKVIKEKNEQIKEFKSQIKCLKSDQEQLKRNSEEEIEKLNEVIEKLQEELSNIDQIDSVGFTNMAEVAGFGQSLEMTDRKDFLPSLSGHGDGGHVNLEEKVMGESMEQFSNISYSVTLGSVQDMESQLQLLESIKEKDLNLKQYFDQIVMLKEERQALNNTVERLNLELSEKEQRLTEIETSKNELPAVNAKTRTHGTNEAVLNNELPETKTELKHIKHELKNIAKASENPVNKDLVTALSQEEGDTNYKASIESLTETLREKTAQHLTVEALLKSVEESSHNTICELQSQLQNLQKSALEKESQLQELLNNSQLLENQEILRLNEVIKMLQQNLGEVEQKIYVDASYRAKANENQFQEVQQHAKVEKENGCSEGDAIQQELVLANTDYSTTEKTGQAVHHSLFENSMQSTGQMMESQLQELHKEIHLKDSELLQNVNDPLDRQEKETGQLNKEIETHKQTLAQGGSGDFINYIECSIANEQLPLQKEELNLLETRAELEEAKIKLCLLTEELIKVKQAHNNYDVIADSVFSKSAPTMSNQEQVLREKTSELLVNQTMCIALEETTQESVNKMESQLQELHRVIELKDLELLKYAQQKDLLDHQTGEVERLNELVKSLKQELTNMGSHALEDKIIPGQAVSLDVKLIPHTDLNSEEHVHAKAELEKAKAEVTVLKEEFSKMSLSQKHDDIRSVNIREGESELELLNTQAIIHKLESQIQELQKTIQLKDVELLQHVQQRVLLDQQTKEIVRLNEVVKALQHEPSEMGSGTNLSHEDDGKRISSEELLDGKNILLKMTDLESSELTKERDDLDKAKVELATLKEGLSEAGWAQKHEVQCLIPPRDSDLSLELNELRQVLNEKAAELLASQALVASLQTTSQATIIDMESQLQELQKNIQLKDSELQQYIQQKDLLDQQTIETERLNEVVKTLHYELSVMGSGDKQRNDQSKGSSEEEPLDIKNIHLQKADLENKELIQAKSELEKAKIELAVLREELSKPSLALKHDVQSPCPSREGYMALGESELEQALREKTEELLASQTAVASLEKTTQSAINNMKSQIQELQKVINQKDAELLQYVSLKDLVDQQNEGVNFDELIKLNQQQSDDHSSNEKEDGDGYSRKAFLGNEVSPLQNAVLDVQEQTNVKAESKLRSVQKPDDMLYQNFSDLDETAQTTIHNLKSQLQELQKVVRLKDSELLDCVNQKDVIDQQTKEIEHLNEVIKNYKIHSEYNRKCSGELLSENDISLKKATSDEYELIEAKAELEQTKMDLAVLSEELTDLGLLQKHDDTWYEKASEEGINSEAALNVSELEQALMVKTQDLLAHQKMFASLEETSRATISNLKAQLQELEKAVQQKDSELLQFMNQQNIVKQQTKEIEQLNNIIGSLQKQLEDDEQKTLMQESESSLSVKSVKELTQQMNGDERTIMGTDEARAANKVREQSSTWFSGTQENLPVQEHHQGMLVADLADGAENTDEDDWVVEALKDKTAELLAKQNVFTSKQESMQSTIDNLEDKIAEIQEVLKEKDMQIVLYSEEIKALKEQVKIRTDEHDQVMLAMEDSLRENVAAALVSDAQLKAIQIHTKCLHVDNTSAHQEAASVLQDCDSKRLNQEESETKLSVFDRQAKESCVAHLEEDLQEVKRCLSHAEEKLAFYMKREIQEEELQNTSGIDFTDALRSPDWTTSSSQTDKVLGVNSSNQTMRVPGTHVGVQKEPEAAQLRTSEEVTDLMEQYTEKISQMQELHAAEILDMEARHISETESLRREQYSMVQALTNECDALKAVIEALKSSGDGVPNSTLSASFHFTDAASSDVGTECDWSQETCDVQSLEQLPEAFRGDEDIPSELIPSKIKDLLRAVHQEGMQVLSLTEASSPEKEPPFKVHKQPWHEERKALLETIASLKELIAKMQIHKGEAHTSSDFHGLTPDWRGELLRAIQEVFQREQDVLMSAFRTQLASMGRADTSTLLNQIQHRLQEQGIEHINAMDCIQNADRRSLLLEIQDLRAQLTSFHSDPEIQSLFHPNAEGRASYVQQEPPSHFQELHMQLNSMNTTASELQEQLGSERILSAEIKNELALTKMELESNLKLQQKHFNELEMLRFELTKKREELDGLNEALANEQKKSRELQYTLEKQQTKKERRDLQEKEKLEDLQMLLEEQKLKIVEITQQLEEERRLAKDLQEQIVSQGRIYDTKLSQERGRVQELQVLLDAEKIRSRELNKAIECQQGLEAHQQTTEVDDTWKEHKPAGDLLGELKGQLDSKHARIVELVSETEVYKLECVQLRKSLDEERQSLRKALDAEQETSRLALKQVEELTATVKDLECQIQERVDEIRRYQAEEKKLKETIHSLQSRPHDIHGGSERRNLSKALTAKKSPSLSESSKLPLQTSGVPNLLCPDPLSVVNGDLVTEQASCGIDGIKQRLRQVSSKLRQLTTKANQRILFEEADEKDLAWSQNSIQDVLSQLEHIVILSLQGQNLVLPAGMSTNTLTEKLLTQNAELTGYVSRLTEEKNDLQNSLLRLEGEVSRYRARRPSGDYSMVDNAVNVDALLAAERELWKREKLSLCRSLKQAEAELAKVKAELRNEVAQRDLGRDSDNMALKRVYGKYLRSESYRKALVYQKKYLLLLLGGFQECEEATLALIARMGGQPTYTDLEVITNHSRAFTRFRSAARAAIAISRMKFLVRRWQRATISVMNRNSPGQNAGNEVRSDSAYHPSRSIELYGEQRISSCRSQSGFNSPQSTVNSQHRYMSASDTNPCSHLQHYDPDKALTDYITRLEALQKRLGTVPSGSSAGPSTTHYSVRR
ncbi:LOW QUALITY PROTEIN: A-kinase anchor protein 9 [Gastrophryne carolinensis]